MPLKKREDSKLLRLLFGELTPEERAEQRQKAEAARLAAEERERQKALDEQRRQEEEALRQQQENAAREEAERLREEKLHEEEAAKQMRATSRERITSLLSSSRAGPPPQPVHAASAANSTLGGLHGQWPQQGPPSRELSRTPSGESWNQEEAEAAQREASAEERQARADERLARAEEQENRNAKGGHGPAVLKPLAWLLSAKSHVQNYHAFFFIALLVFFAEAWLLHFGRADFGQLDVMLLFHIGIAVILWILVFGFVSNPGALEMLLIIAAIAWIYPSLIAQFSLPANVLRILHPSLHPIWLYAYMFIFQKESRLARWMFLFFFVVWFSFIFFGMMVDANVAYNQVQGSWNNAWGDLLSETWHRVTGGVDNARVQFNKGIIDAAGPFYVSDRAEKGPPPSGLALADAAAVPNPPVIPKKEFFEGEPVLVSAVVYQNTGVDESVMFSRVTCKADDETGLPSPSRFIYAGGEKVPVSCNFGKLNPGKHTATVTASYRFSTDASYSTVLMSLKELRNTPEASRNLKLCGGDIARSPASPRATSTDGPISIGIGMPDPPIGLIDLDDPYCTPVTLTCGVAEAECSSDSDCCSGFLCGADSECAKDKDASCAVVAESCALDEFGACCSDFACVDKGAPPVPVCGDVNSACSSDAECCGGLSCNADNACEPDDPAACAIGGDACDSAKCCSGFLCGDDKKCAVETMKQGMCELGTYSTCFLPEIGFTVKQVHAGKLSRITSFEVIMPRGLELEESGRCAFEPAAGNKYVLKADVKKAYENVERFGYNTFLCKLRISAEGQQQLLQGKVCAPVTIQAHAEYEFELSTEIPNIVVRRATSGAALT